MPNVLIRDLPADVHAELQRRASLDGRSLQQFLTAELTRLASMPTAEDVLRRIAERQGGRIGLAQAVADLEEGRR